MASRLCDRCEFEPLRFEVMDRKFGNIQLLCDVCLLQWALTMSDEVRDEIDRADRRREGGENG